LSTGGLRPGVAINHSIPPHQQHTGAGNAPPQTNLAMQYLLPIIAMGNFAAGLTSRAIDPLLPQIAARVGHQHPAPRATLAASTAIAFAFVQLPLGAVADLFASRG